MRPIADVGTLDERLRAIYGGRSWIVTTDAATAATGVVSQLSELGSPAQLVVSATKGTGESPEAPVVETGASGSSIMGGIRAFERSVVEPSPAIAEKVQAFIAEHSSVGLLPSNLFRAGQLFGIAVHGAKRPEWGLLEDKTVVDGLWERAQIAHAPVEIVAVEGAAGAHGRLDRGQGTVWAADNRDGWHGGGEYTKWVVGGGIEEAVGWFARRADLVRVMPFLEGIPCSIHGFVTGNGVSVFRPVEMIILRDVDRHAFVYAGVSTNWDPSAQLRDEMRDAARSVGRRLADEVEYRGPFSIDGVATDDGFRPTELNPRLSVGLGVQAAQVDGLPLALTTSAVISGDLDIDAEWLESLVVERADEDRHRGFGLPLAQTVEPVQVTLDMRDGVPVGTSADAGDEGSVANVEIGPSAGGSFMRCRFGSDVLEVGPPIAPVAARTIAWVSSTYGLALPDLVAAPAG